MLTKRPLGVWRSEPPSSSREEKEWRAGRLRLRDRRWWREEEAESSVEEAPTGILLVVDLNAAVAIGERGN